MAQPSSSSHLNPPVIATDEAMISQPLRKTTPVALLLFLLIEVAGTVSGQHSKPAKPGARTSAKTYSIAHAQSQITVLLTQEGMLRKLHPTHAVAVKTFSGRVQLLAGDESKAVVEVEAETRSLTNIDKNMSSFERDGFQDVLHKNVLESDRFPNIRFRSVSVTNLQTAGDSRSFTLNGDLTLHGVTKRVAFPVTVVIKDGQLRATGEEKIRQTDFGMKPYSGGLGSIKISDEMKVSFVIMATAQQSHSTVKQSTDKS